jgi:hypothetical protein
MHQERFRGHVCGGKKFRPRGFIGRLGTYIVFPYVIATSGTGAQVLLLGRYTARIEIIIGMIIAFVFGATIGELACRSELKLSRQG